MSRGGDGPFGVVDARDGVAVASECVYRTPAHKDPGSWQDGWEPFRERLKNVMKPEGPRPFVFNTCRQFISTVPILPRDEIDMDGVDSKAEDHLGEAGIRLGPKERSPFCSRSQRRFPCGRPEFTRKICWQVTNVPDAG